MNVDELLSRYPRLYHMAQAGSWPTIRERGLMTTAQLVDAYTPPAEVRAAVLQQRRSQSITLNHPGLGRVVIRDQAPLREQFLTGTTMIEWLDMLNDRVFFWLHSAKLAQLLGARRYRNDAHDVLTVDTASLVAEHSDQIRLSPINSGAALYPNAPERGSGTFMPIDTYPYEEMRRRRGAREAIIELAVIDGVPDITRHVLRVERRHNDKVIDVLYP